MNVATSATSVIRRVTSIKDIIGIIGAHHPHVVGAGFLQRFIERQRIAQAIHAEAERLSFCLVTLADERGNVQGGILTAVPKPPFEEVFASYGPAPMLFGFLFGFQAYNAFHAVMQEVRRIGWENRRRSIVGPVEATINYQCGLLEAPPAFPLGVLMPDNPIDWNQHFERFGFAVAERLFTFEIELSRANFRRLRANTATDLGLDVQQLKPPFSAAQRVAIADVFNSGWRDNWGFVPIDVEYIAALEKEFSPVLWPGLSFIAYKGGRPVGVLVATPDINELTRTDPSRGLLGLPGHVWRFFWRRRARAIRIFILGLVPEFHRTREGAAIVELMLDMGNEWARRYAATHILMGWTLSSNRSVNRLVELWAPEAKRVVHRMWQYQLTDAAGEPKPVSNRPDNSG
jgi:hypothetical protein